LYDFYGDDADIDSSRAQINFSIHSVRQVGRCSEEGLLMSSRHKSNSAFYPSDLQLCQRVFDQVCLERRLDPMSREPDVQQLAATVFSLFENGYSDEAELLASFRRPRQ
jgi:hypothetical protein